MTTWAVIVGIEQYDEHGLDVKAPGANAIAVARWALSVGVDPSRILLFVSKLDPILAQAGVKERRTDLREIDTILRTELPKATQGSTLLFYWSGHGMADQKGQRLFFCSDYTQILADRVFNATLFFRKLRGDTYSGFRRMLALADVCGINSNTPVEPASYDPGRAFPREHLIYFATPEGGHALASTGEGAFTYSALKVLGKYRTFPDLERFKKELDTELKSCRLDRFLLSVKTETDEYESLYGAARRSDDQIANSLLELLVKHDIQRCILETHFFATARAMNNEGLFDAQGITGMIWELSNLCDPDPGATHAIVQFVLRLCGDPDLEVHKPAMTVWLELYSSPSTIRDEQARLTAEHGRKLLIFNVEHDSLGGIASLTPSLRNLDQTQVRGRIFDSVAVRTWEELESAVVCILQKLKVEELADDLEIHFVVEERSFDRPFHRLCGLSPGVQLGEEFVLVLHHRDRVRPGPSASKRRWLKRVDAARNLGAARLDWAKCQLGRVPPLEPILCLAAFPVTSGPSGVAGKKILGKLVTLGAPFIYWPIDSNEPDAEQSLKLMIRGLSRLSEMPEAFLQKRMAEAGIVASGSLLWDEPTFRPYGG
jgi:hypothetical protein